ncbi:MAG: WG repeat-containing protein, partial [Ruminococcus sp.]|nr:WG repeat-containing protein [Ruminococcus sp.]
MTDLIKKINTIGFLAAAFLLTSCASNADTVNAPELSETADTEISELPNTVISETTAAETAEEESSEAASEILPETEPFEMLFPVYLSGYFEYIDKNGNVVTDGKYDKAYFFGDGLAAVCKDGKYGAVDLRAQTAVPMSFGYLGGFHCGMSVVKDEREGGLSGYINSAGEIVVPIEHTYASDFSEGAAVVWQSSGYSYAIDINGAELYEVGCSDYAFIGKAREGLLRHHAYFLDARTGETVIDDLLDRRDHDFLCFYPDGFSEGLAAYPVPKDFTDENYIPENDENYYEDSANWKYGYIDTAGKWAIEPVFDSAAYFSEGLASAEKDGRRGVIDKTGEFVFYSDGVTG